MSVKVAINEEVKEATGGIGSSDATITYTTTSYHPGYVYHDRCAPGPAITSGPALGSSVTLSSVTAPAGANGASDSGSQIITTDSIVPNSEATTRVRNSGFQTNITESLVPHSETNVTASAITHPVTNTTVANVTRSATQPATMSVTASAGTSTEALKCFLIKTFRGLHAALSKAFDSLEKLGQMIG